jgi:hypothetical protein
VHDRASAIVRLQAGQGALLAGYLHFHLWTDPAWADAWVGRMERFRMMRA